MENFKNYLKQEFMSRLNRNPSYSLRAFAKHLDMNHATLSSILTGKRKITRTTLLKLSGPLHMSPQEIDHFLETESKESPMQNPAYYNLQQDTFALMSDWYYDAILELNLIRDFDFRPRSIAKALNIPELQARLALETLVRLKLLCETDGKFVLTHKFSTNIADPSLTSKAQRKYQKQILEKSLLALEEVDLSERDHTSITMAVNTKDLPQIKELVKKFRQDLNTFTQRKEAQPNHVYQLQISFFPLTYIESQKETNL